jgi:hypothetical protein
MSLRNNPVTREKDCFLCLVPGHCGQNNVIASARLGGVTFLALNQTRLVHSKIHFPKRYAGDIHAGSLQQCNKDVAASEAGQPLHLTGES